MRIKLDAAAYTLGAAILLIAPLKASASSIDLFDGTFNNITPVQSVGNRPFGFGLPPLNSIAVSVVSPLPFSDTVKADNSAINVQFNFSSQTPPNVGAGVGILDNSLTFNPQTTGAISSLNFSTDKALAADNSGTPTRLLLEQDGKFFVFITPNQANTANQFAQFSGSNLTSSDFTQICLVNCATGTFNTPNGQPGPNFSGDAITFGLLQAANNSTGLNTSAFYDNLDVDVTFSQAVPEPSTWAMMILGFCGLSFLSYRKKSAFRFA
jgi:hypothetical protein